MTITKPSELEGLKMIGKIVALTLRHMGSAIEPGMTTRELDEIGRRRLEEEGARPAPELAYDFPGAACISINHVVAHGIPGEQVIERDDLVDIDVSAEKNGFRVPLKRPKGSMFDVIAWARSRTARPERRRWFRRVPS